MRSMSPPSSHDTLSWAHARRVQLRLIQPDKPNQNVSVESFNGRLGDKCLTTLLHARTEIEQWRREYNEEGPKDAIGGMTLAAYAKHLANIESTPASKPDHYSRQGGRRRPAAHRPTLRQARPGHNRAGCKRVYVAAPVGSQNLRGGRGPQAILAG